MLSKRTYSAPNQTIEVAKMSKSEPERERQSADACRGAIRESGLRATPARIAVLQLLRRAERPLSHADVCDLLDESMWNRTTVWRNLSDLEGAGLVRRTELGDRVWRFEESASSGEHDAAAHPHFICTRCGDVECLPDEAMELHLPRSLQGHQVEVQVRGVCGNCG